LPNTRVYRGYMIERDRKEGEKEGGKGGRKLHRRP
jgi:hypothetical protein